MGAFSLPAVELQGTFMTRRRMERFRRTHVRYCPSTRAWSVHPARSRSGQEPAPLPDTGSRDRLNPADLRNGTVRPNGTVRRNHEPASPTSCMLARVSCCQVREVTRFERTDGGLSSCEGCRLDPLSLPSSACGNRLLVIHRMGTRRGRKHGGHSHRVKPGAGRNWTDVRWQVPGV